MRAITLEEVLDRRAAVLVDDGDGAGGIAGRFRAVAGGVEALSHDGVRKDLRAARFYPVRIEALALGHFPEAIDETGGEAPVHVFAQAS